MYAYPRLTSAHKLEGIRDISVGSILIPMISYDRSHYVFTAPRLPLQVTRFSNIYLFFVFVVSLLG